MLNFQNEKLSESPEDTYRSYQRFYEKHDYAKAYKCLSNLLSEFPEDTRLLEHIITISIVNLNDLETGRKWVKKIIDIRSLWIDYLLLGNLEIDLGNINKAKECLNKAKALQRKQPSIKSASGNPEKVFKELETSIRNKELQLIARLRPGIEINRKNRKGEIKKAPEPVNKQNTFKPEQVLQIQEYSLPIRFEMPKDDVFSSFFSHGISTFKESQMLVDYTYLSLQKGYDDLVCLNSLNNIEKFWYQIETVKKVLKRFHGRVLLCDEVGLGKTIEAGLLIKEYITRGMVKNILILAPSTLVSQWKEEMRSKFDIEFITTGDIEFSRDPENFWKQRFIIASINTAKRNSNIQNVTGQFYDLVVVDEAHHLRNRNTLAWALANQIKKKFIFLLTATPLQNNLVELFNLITLLKPGQFKTEKSFRQEYVEKGSLKKPANKERLRELLRDVMIRNTRSAIDIKLPKRFASTLRLEPSKPENSGKSSRL